MLLSDTARERARMLSAVAAGLAALVASAAWFGMDDHDWILIVPVLASVAAAVRPTRLIVATALLVTATVLVLGLEGSGVLFGATTAALMLALNNLQSAATRVRRFGRPAQHA